MMPLNGFMDKEVKETIWRDTYVSFVMLSSRNKQLPNLNSALQCFIIISLLYLYPPLLQRMSKGVSQLQLYSMIFARDPG